MISNSFGVIFDPLPTLKSDIINKRSLARFFLKNYDKKTDGIGIFGIIQDLHI